MRGSRLHAPGVDRRVAERRGAVVLSRLDRRAPAGGCPASPSRCSSVFRSSRWFLTWELRRRGEELQITDEGVLRRLARGDSEYVRWSELREVSIVVTQGVNLTEEYFYVLAGTGTSGVLVGQRLAAEARPAVAPEQTTRLRSSQHRRRHGVAGEPALHAVARGAARR